MFVAKSRTETPEEVLLHNASTIRVWGTTRGLGELCAGPTATTQLDPIPEVVHIPRSMLIWWMLAPGMLQ